MSTWFLCATTKGVYSPKATVLNIVGSMYEQEEKTYVPYHLGTRAREACAKLLLQQPSFSTKPDWTMESMTNQQILTKAMQKAIDGGWKPAPRRAVSFDDVNYLKWRLLQDDNYMSAIFNHDFAKALWGELPLWRITHFTDNAAFRREEDMTDMPNWCHHLQQMVIVDDPIKYLADNML